MQMDAYVLDTEPHILTSPKDTVLAVLQSLGVFSLENEIEKGRTTLFNLILGQPGRATQQQLYA